ncbi:MAG: hypothetical protein ACRDUV_00825 [Pseudonocardiaceae bacterium]
MSAAVQRGESVAAPHARDLRCGRRSEPAMHLVEADGPLVGPDWRLGSRDHVALCGAELTEDTPTPDFDDCPGCQDCSRYCQRCVRMATAAVADVNGPGENATTVPGLRA